MRSRAWRQGFGGASDARNSSGLGGRFVNRRGFAKWEWRWAGYFPCFIIPAATEIRFRERNVGVSELQAQPQ